MHPFLIDEELFLTDYSHVEALPPLKASFKTYKGFNYFEFSKGNKDYLISPIYDALQKILFADGSFSISGENSSFIIRNICNFLGPWQRFDLSVIEGNNHFSFPENLISPRIRLLKGTEFNENDHVIPIKSKIIFEEKSSIKKVVKKLLTKDDNLNLLKIYFFTSNYSDSSIVVEKQNRFMEGLIKILSIIDEMGTIDPAKLEPDHLHSVIPFFAAGSFSLGFQILEYFANNISNLPLGDERLLNSSCKNVVKLRDAFEKYEIVEMSKAIEKDLERILAYMHKSFDLF